MIRESLCSVDIEQLSLLAKLYSELMLSKFAQKKTYSPRQFDHNNQYRAIFSLSIVNIEH
jgi:hypothetical protein